MKRKLRLFFFRLIIEIFILTKYSLALKKKNLYFLKALHFLWVKFKENAIVFLNNGLINEYIKTNCTPIVLCRMYLMHNKDFFLIKLLYQ